jgi:glutamate-1-semialdehyde 2,1-aminomutase
VHKGYNKSQNLYQEAKEYIPGGVNSPVRAFKAVGDYPVFIESGFGSKLYDVDGNTYIDYVGSWGPLILGHRHPKVIEALKNCLNIGTSFGAPTKIETEMAKFITQAIPSIEMVRMVNSGTEATMSALRLARAYTKRDKILKFEGCYHGHADPLLIKAGSGALTFGVPSSPGVPTSIAGGTITASYNDLEQVTNIFKEFGEEIAAIIIEPVPGNMGLILPEDGFLEGLRTLTKEYGALLIFDEVMSGFRLTLGGAQSLFNITPDLTCLGKIIGGGLPVGAFGGRREIMEFIAPQGPVYQAGTLSGNPLAMTAGLTTLKELTDPQVYEKLARLGEKLTNGLRKTAENSGVDVWINNLGSMACCFFTKEKVKDYNTAVSANVNKFKAFFQAMLSQGVYLAPSQFEALFISLAHTEEDIEKTIKASETAFNLTKTVE